MSTAVTVEAATLETVQGIGPASAPSLRSNFKWTFAGNVIYAACQWGMLSVLAKAGSAAMVGQFALGLAVAAPVFMFSNLQLRAVQATDARSEYEFADYFTLRVLASALGLMVVAGLAWRLPYDAATRWVVMLVAASKTVESLSDVVAGLLQKHERLNQVAMSLMIRGALSLAAFGSMFLWKRNLVAATAALVVTWMAVFAVYDLWRARGVMGSPRKYFRFDRERLRRLLVVSAPLGVVMTLVSLNINTPRYMLVKYLGEAELGMFASMAYILVAVTLIVNALGQSASARLARVFAARDFAGFRSTLGKLLMMAMAVPLVGVPVAMVFGRRLLTLLYRAEYGDHVNVLVIMMVTAGLTAVGSFLGYGMTAARSFRAQVPVIGAMCVTTVGLCLVLIPRMGLEGAALALLASTLLQCVGFKWALGKAVREAEIG
jgi:O-antigen/teichoic acid export membrane protein